MMNRKKHRYMLLAGMMLLGAAGAGSTLSYFTESDSATNVFTMGDLDIGLNEKEWDPNPEDGSTPDGENMYPGYCVYKNPTVKNLTSDKNGEEPCYIRMKVHILDASGQPVEEQEAIDLIKKTIYYDESYNGSYSEKGSSKGLIEGRIPGYSLKELADYPMVNPDFELDVQRSEPSVLVYNYMGGDQSGVMKIGTESALFTNIVIPTDWNQTHLKRIGDYHLEIRAESIQCSGFDSQDDAMLALDQEIANGTLQKLGQ